MSIQSINRLIEQSNNAHKGFTLVELLVVVGMIALIMGALTTSVSAAMQRARIQKATADVKMLTQAIQSYANYKGGELKDTGGWKDADFKSQEPLKDMNGSDEKIPVLIQAAISKGGVMRDPWGKPYQIKITKKGTVLTGNKITDMETGYYLPNFYRLTEDERSQ